MRILEQNELAQKDVDRFREFAARQFGLSLESGNPDQVVDALQRGMLRTKCASVATYLQQLEAGAVLAPEWGALIADLTVAETYFFRHPDQFQAVLEQVILPWQRERKGHFPLRMLSAGCASGEEACSLAILLADHLPPAAATVTGIDLNPNLIARARRGHYTDWSLRGVSPEVQRRHFERVGTEFVVRKSVRDLVSFSNRNLIDDDPAFWQPGVFDVIFCRNVIMYFTPEAVRAVVSRLARSLAPRGLLFLGPAETLRGISHEFHLQHSHDTFYYERKDENAGAEEHSLELRRPPLETSRAGLWDVAENPQWVSAISRATRRVALLSQTAGGPRTEETLSSQTRHGPSKKQTARTRTLEDARQFLLEERFEEALEFLEAVTRDESPGPDAQLLQAALLINGGRVAEGDRLCQSVLTGDELNPEAHYLLALCREHAADVEGAMEQDRTAIYLDPRFAMPHLHLGLLARRVGDLGTARGSFRSAAALLPREDTSRIVLFGGGFDRNALVQLCQLNLRALGDPS